MKRALLKLSLLIMVPAVLAGIVFFMCAFSRSLPAGVRINGLNVGGMPHDRAIAAVRAEIERELGQKKLTVTGKNGEYSFTYPEISYKDDLNALVGNIKKGGDYSARVEYYLCGGEETLSYIALSESVPAEEPRAEFLASGEPFLYFGGADGREADVPRLKRDVQAALKGDLGEVEIHYIKTVRKSSLQEIKERTSLLGEFTTYFDNSNLSRASNIRLAAELLNGCSVESGATLSFNERVGPRTAERGFLPAKIIENGEYTEGVGGGVCQVSTTLYNAALLSGLKIAEYHPHSLAVGYVPPSRDAMVSGSACDLKITNPTPYPVYLRAEGGEGRVRLRIYGKSDGVRYSLESEVLGSVPAPEEECSDPSSARDGKDGVISEGYLVAERGGYKKRMKLRTDKYLPVKRVVYSPPQEDTTQNIVDFEKTTPDKLCLENFYVILEKYFRNDKWRKFYDQNSA